MSTTLEKGKIIKDRYQIEKLIGKGGQKKVYLVSDLKGEAGATKLALKQMLGSTSKAGSVANMHLFEQEAIILSGLRHSAIPKIFDYFVEEGRFYIVQEFIGGDSLSNLVHKHTFSQEEILNLALQMADCLEYLHRCRPPIIYRDLKPQNVKIMNSRVYLIDFSGALLPGIGDEAERMTVYSRGYTPPGAHKRKVVDFTYDTYSLGVVLFEMLTRYNVKGSKGNLPPLQTLRADVSPEIREIVNKAVYPGHYWQYQTMWEMKMELDGALQSTKKLEILEEKKKKNPLLFLLILLHKFRISLIQPLLALFTLILIGLTMCVPSLLVYFKPTISCGFLANPNFLYILSLYMLLVIVIWGRWFAGVHSFVKIYKKFYTPLPWLGKMRPVSLLVVINIIILILLNIYFIIHCFL